jgi:hypothetical protein
MQVNLEKAGDRHASESYRIFMWPHEKWRSPSLASDWQVSIFYATSTGTTAADIYVAQA